MPVSLDDIIDPEITQHHASITLSSKHNEVIVIAEHEMTSSWLWNRAVVLHLLPCVPLLVVLIEVIKMDHLLALVVSASEHPESLELVAASSMILSRSKPI